MKLTINFLSDSMCMRFSSMLPMVSVVWLLHAFSRCSSSSSRLTGSSLLTYCSSAVGAGGGAAIRVKTRTRNGFASTSRSISSRGQTSSLSPSVLSPEDGLLMSRLWWRWCTWWLFTSPALAAATAASSFASDADSSASVVASATPSPFACADAVASWGACSLVRAPPFIHPIVKDDRNSPPACGGVSSSSSSTTPMPVPPPVSPSVSELSGRSPPAV
mmetsp:Transcript_27064/g.63266  ORF Transcript_27064/g.63266 Transcript_27064/m.63266 type:complete len:218 (+) Transcript_27064:889-1542(+)